MMLPVVNGSQTNWNNLYAVLKEAEKLWELVYCNGKRIITFDLQLYIEAMRLQERLMSKVVSCFEWLSYMLLSVCLTL